MRRVFCFFAAFGIACASGAGGVGAQVRTVEEVDLPLSVAGEVIDFFNHPSTIRFSGRARIPESRKVIGDVGSLAGDFTVAGEIDGTLMVVNGDLTFEEGASVTGDVWVLGGNVIGADHGLIGGTLTIYSERLRYSRRGDRLVRAGRDRGDRPSRFWNPNLGIGRSRITVRTGTSYNRIEGLPVLFGPIMETGNANPFRIEALAIWRTDSGLELDGDELGYFVRAEQRFGREGGVAFGATAHSSIEPIEEWGLSDLETSLGAFLFHQDFRDYFDRSGFSGYVRVDAPAAYLTITAEYREDEYEFAPVGGPWSLKDNDAPWRPQPLVGEGTFRSVTGEVLLDARNDEDLPSDGWYLALRGRLGVSGGLTVPDHLTTFDETGAPSTGDPGARTDALSFDSDLSTGFVDIRRYLRVGPGSVLSLRGLWGGSLTDDPLPPQFQHAFGGEGSVPGIGRFQGDCGARAGTGGRVISRRGITETVPVFPTYGCDRIAVFQAEYRSSFRIDVSIWDDDEWDDWGAGRSGDLDLDFGWSVFFDAAKGWSLADDPSQGFLGADTEVLKDVGVGMYLGGLGLMWAFPLDGDDKDVNFFVRLRHRF